MKKKRARLKKWVALLLGFNMFLLLILASSEVEDLGVFVISKIIMMILFYLHYIILDKYYITIS